MLNVCQNHVKNGLKDLDVPHVKKVKEKNLICSFCNKEAEIKMFCSGPFAKNNLIK